MIPAETLFSLRSLLVSEAIDIDVPYVTSVQSFPSYQVFDLPQAQGLWYLQGFGLHIRKPYAPDSIKLYAISSFVGNCFHGCILLRRKPIYVNVYENVWNNEV